MKPLTWSLLDWVSMRHILRGCLLTSLVFVALILGLVVLIAFSDQEDGPNVYALLSVSTGLIFPMLMLAFWVSSVCILSLTVMLIHGMKPLKFSLSSIAIAVLVGGVIDLLFGYGGMILTSLLFISVFASSVTVISLNRQSAKTV
jgi:hypothetical protein